MYFLFLITSSVLLLLCGHHSEGKQRTQNRSDGELLLLSPCEIKSRIGMESFSFCRLFLCLRTEQKQRRRRRRRRRIQLLIGLYSCTCGNGNDLTFIGYVVVVVYKRPLGGGGDKGMIEYIGKIHMAAAAASLLYSRISHRPFSSIHR